MRDFSQKVAAGLEKCGIGFSSNPPSLLLAVSGGIDSMVMLYALKELSEKMRHDRGEKPPFFLSVVTVNHNIRPAVETEGDAVFVKQCCAVLDIPCSIQTVPTGRICELARQRNGGIEEAARFVRYGLLEKEAAKNGADFVLLAHNRDDQLETLLQRFLQGSCAGISGQAAAGIAPNRGIFCRPLLDITRSEIQAYAEDFSVPFHEDRTNADPAYYRNNLRLHLVPLLNERFSGWDTALLSGAEKARETGFFIEELAAAFVWKPLFEPNCSNEAGTSGGQGGCSAVCTQTADFFAAGFPVRIRALYAALEKIGMQGRIPYALLNAFARGQKKVCGAGAQLYRTKRFVCVQRTCAGYQREKNKPFKAGTASSADFESGGKKNVQGGYSVEIRGTGLYTLPFGTVEVRTKVQKSGGCAENKYERMYTGPFRLPFVIRNFYTAGRIKTADGKHKSFKKICSEWGIVPTHRGLIPVIEYAAVPLCIWGAPLGYPTWYVKDSCPEKDDAVFLFLRKV